MPGNSMHTPENKPPTFSAESHASLSQVEILGTSVSTLSFDEQIQQMVTWATNRLSKTVLVANVHMLVEAHKDKAFAQVLAAADLVTPDGMPLVWMSQWLTKKRQDRVAGMDILLALSQKAEAQGIGVYFFGAEPATLQLMRRKLAEAFPQLNIAGMKTLPFCDTFTPAQNDMIVQSINESGAGIVFVALGCPKQEKWMCQNRDRVNAVMIGVGGAFSVYAGLKKWAPVWVRSMGLEWLYRLCQEPKRLWKRYLITNSIFLALAMKAYLIHRCGFSSRQD